ncbi:DegT/DnrJ/EryC1/StrS family aminotransferase [Bacteroides fragilis]|uniref:Aminotransferase class V-fold PLP-dependent enzyme n=1 Tax=Bacteroides fragilis TaxID=817 RepID=A0AAP8ZQM5_BACFG|nr:MULTISPECIES: DegT/DnrJ/EryC1/StrS family aminotransferase [Bacteroides]MBV4155842.1 aminotransferase class V-fold PLP-dependent enzyme [Bacteroides fragilis]MCE8577526.1 DegT/DnrJ/EryC1/StrS family aminotransferase [Bacteroides fragilis]MCE8648351.1 DegT/DnrJ/EryC1/StrS family aminotransferase [Bacteroides fragilis]MCM0367366.1 aminotransferase class V-fold PLP-dependent enzyme [Bacteroides fragilis]MCS2534615.1 DegT/DnrJ/EryC1/StrS family aminotransferase [Bacteroides fragilis]
MIPLVKPYIPDRKVLMPELENVLYSGYIAEGQPVYDFEKRFQTFIGNPYCLALHSGTDALHLALLLAGVGIGDEVISTPMTAEPTNVAITMVGAKVVWGDVHPATGLLDPDSVRSQITSKTKAIIVVHYAGMVCDMTRFNQISKEFNIPVIEDAAHALGSKFDGQYVGCNSDYTIFSLQAIKHMTTVDGGFLALKSQENMDKARIKRWFGLDKTKSRLENDIKETGYKYSMNNVNATIGLVQMHFLRSVLDKYISNGKFYDNSLQNIDGLQLIPYYDKTEPSYWLYTMKVDHRDDFVKMLESNGIMASPLHHRNDTHSLFSTSRRILPGLEDFYGKLVHIPCGWWVTEKDRLKIVDCIKNGW